MSVLASFPVAPVDDTAVDRHGILWRCVFFFASSTPKRANFHVDLAEVGGQTCEPGKDL